MRAAIWLGIAAVLVAGCASVGPGSALVPGTSREADAIERFGKPTDQRRLPDGGQVLDFSRAPLGYENWRVTFSKDGTVRTIEQLLDGTHFGKLKPGMTMDEAKEVLGRPGDTATYRAVSEVVIMWRFMDGPTRMFFNAHFDAATGRLKYTSRQDEFRPLS